MPTKTFVLVLKNSQFSISRDIARTFVICEKLLALWQLNVAHAAASWQTVSLFILFSCSLHIYLQLEARVKRNYQTEDFHVQVVDLLDGSTPLIFEKT